MQSSPPQESGKARAIRELSRSLSHSPRQIPPNYPPASESNPTVQLASTTNSFSEDLLHSTQQHLHDIDTDTLPQPYPRIRSTAKKMNTWQMQRSEAPNLDTSMVAKEFKDFDSDDDVSMEQARGDARSKRSTPAKFNSSFQTFDPLYDMTPPSRTRRTNAGDQGSLRRDAQIRRASRNDLDTASPRPSSTRKSTVPPANNERKRTSLAQLHAKVSEDESSFMHERPPTMTFHSKNTRWGGTRSRNASLQLDATIDAATRTPPATAQNATAQSFILPDIPNLTELVSGVFQDGTPLFSKTTPARSHPNARNGRPSNFAPITDVPLPEEEKVIFAALQILKDRVAEMEHETAQAHKTIEEQDQEINELRAMHERYRRSDSALGSTDGEGSGKTSWKVEKTRLEATVQTLRTKLDRVERKTDVLEIEKRRLGSERDNIAAQLAVAFQSFEELKAENENLRTDNESLRQENESLHNQLEQNEAHFKEETVQLQERLNHTGNATQKENISLRAELAQVRSRYDENTQTLNRKKIELAKARKEQAEYAKLKSENEKIKARLADLKAQREEEYRRWSEKEAALRSRVDRRDETIRHFQDMTQEQTNEAVRLDNESLRQELAQLVAQQEETNRQWSRTETELKWKMKERDQMNDLTREILTMRHANDRSVSTPTGKEDVFAETNGIKSRYVSDDNTRTRIRRRVQEEIRNSKVKNPTQPGNQTGLSPRKIRADRAGGSHRTLLDGDVLRSVSAPNRAYHPRLDNESEVESTTDLSLAPQRGPHAMRIDASGKKQPTQVEKPADLELTELSFIDSAQIAQLRRVLEEERAAARNRAVPVPLESSTRDDTIRSGRPAREDTGRSIASASSRRPSLPRKSSLKEATKTNVTEFEEDVTGNVSNLDNGDATATQTKQSAIDISMLSNTSRRRRSAPTEMTSAFILPDIKVSSGTTGTGSVEVPRNIESRNHDNDNCTVCRRDNAEMTAGSLQVPKLVPVSSRMPDDIDATLRPAQSPQEALALVVKELQDERAHLHLELNVMRAHLETLDVSLGMKKRKEVNKAIQDFLRLIEIKDTQIYNLYDVLEGQECHELTEEEVEDLTRELRTEEKKAKDKKVTIQSYIDSEDEHSAALNDDEDSAWEGFEETQSLNFTGTNSKFSVN